MDDPGGSIYQLALIAILLALSALFSGSETALFSLSPIRTRQLVEKQVPKAEKVHSLQQQSHDMLGSLLVGNTVVNIVMAAVVTSLAFSWWGANQKSELLATLLGTLLLLVFGEITPKVLAAHNPEGFSLRIASIISVIMHWSRPLVRFLNLFNPFGNSGKEASAPRVTEEIIKAAVTIGEEEGVLDLEERQMIYGILSTGDKTVSKVMLPISKAIRLPLDATVRQAAQSISDFGYSRYPVFDASQRVAGMIYTKDLLPLLNMKKWDERIDGLLRPIKGYSSHLTVGMLLSEMRGTGQQMVVINNIKGLPIGLVTIEDLIEEIVGEIDDEHDRRKTTTARRSTPSVSMMVEVAR